MDPNKDLSELVKRMRAVMRPALDFQVHMQKTMKPLLESVQQANRLIEPILKQQKDFLKFIKQLEEDRKDTRKVLLDSGWWLTPSMMDMPANWITSAVAKYKNGNKNAIFNLYRRVYQNNNCEGLGQLVNHWKSKPLLKPWSLHFDHVLEAHRQKKYILCIPVLLLIAEGVAGEFCDKNKISASKSNAEDKIKKSLRNHYQKSGDILVSNLDLLEGAMSSTIYQNTNKLKSNLKKKILNRHAILHGIKKDYGSMKTSLQAFMLVDMLSELR